MRVMFQLHLNGKNRAGHNFKTADEALVHQDRLVRFCKDKIASGQFQFNAYLREAKQLAVRPVEIKYTGWTFSVVESAPGCQGVVRNYFEKPDAEAALAHLRESSARHYSMMESYVHGAS